MLSPGNSRHPRVGRRPNQRIMPWLAVCIFERLRWIVSGGGADAVDSAQRFGKLVPTRECLATSSAV